MATTHAKPAPQVKPAVDARQAVRSAMAYCHQLFGCTSISDIDLEELERSEDHKYWLVTLSFTEPLKSRTYREFLPVPHRKLKVFKVNAQTGEVVAVKMRDA